ncbi:MAG: hypothetical protein AB203_02380 [Parcubacteria bacterium C7867-008]|nr:MAG: hypothetical protein AB203_02380 [Parcubacteria bacterium C7867-008]
MSFESFNLVEAGFWVACAVLTRTAIGKVKNIGPFFWKLLSINFFLFGLSDLAELMYGESFLLPGGEWLYLWKTLCVLGFVALTAYYLWVRIFSGTVTKARY